MSTKFLFIGLVTLSLLGGCTDPGPDESQEPDVTQDPEVPLVPWWLNETHSLVLYPQPPGATNGEGQNCIMVTVKGGPHELISGNVTAVWSADNVLANELKLIWLQHGSVPFRTDEVKGTSPLVFDASTMAQAHYGSEYYTFSVESPVTGLTLEEDVEVTFNLEFKGNVTTQAGLGWCNIST